MSKRTDNSKFAVFVYGNSWRAEFFETREEMELHIKNQNNWNYGHDFLVMKILDYKVNVEVDNE
jgi:hypothetical protein